MWALIKQSKLYWLLHHLTLDRTTSCANFIRSSSSVLPAVSSDQTFHRSTRTPCCRMRQSRMLLWRRDVSLSWLGSFTSTFTTVSATFNPRYSPPTRSTRSASYPCSHTLDSTWTCTPRKSTGILPLTCHAVLSNIFFATLIALVSLLLPVIEHSREAELIVFAAAIRALLSRLHENELSIGEENRLRSLVTIDR